jgi:hypothetical protein
VTLGNVRIADALIRRMEQHAARRGVIDEEPVMLRAGYTQSASIDFRETIKVIGIVFKWLAMQGLSR